MAFRLEDLARHVDADLHGDPDCLIDRVDTIQDGDAGAICFLANQKYRKYLSSTRSSAVILSQEMADECRVNAIVCDNPYLAYARISTLMHPLPEVRAGVHPAAVVSPEAHIDPGAEIAPGVVVEAGASIGSGTYIGPGSVVGSNCSIGVECRLVANVTLCADTRIGDRVLIHPGAVLGSDGFGMANDNGIWEKVPQLGCVRVGNDVEIGANTTVDRGALRDTVIDDGVKLDNQIQVAHNVRIGAHTAIAGCTGIAGSTTVGKHCTMGGGVVVVGHLDIGDNVHISAMSLVTKSFQEPGLFSGNLPAVPNSEWRKTVARLRRMEELNNRLRILEKSFSMQADKEREDN